MDLTTVDHLLTTTRSVRKRFDYGRPVPRDVVEECAQPAFRAPNGGTVQAVPHRLHARHGVQGHRPVEVACAPEPMEGVIA